MNESRSVDNSIRLPPPFHLKFRPFLLPSRTSLTPPFAISSLLLTCLQQSSLPSLCLTLSFRLVYTDVLSTVLQKGDLTIQLAFTHTRMHIYTLSLSCWDFSLCRALTHRHADSEVVSHFQATTMNQSPTTQLLPSLSCPTHDLHAPVWMEYVLD